VGGTSTDVSRFSGRYEIVYETTTAGVTIQSPQLDINTVAAGGGSCLTFRNGLFLAGPESAGAEPGPTCYRYEELPSSADWRPDLLCDVGKVARWQ
jgi:5-oxoprolinase (ATP-hydrolysing)